MIASNRDEFKSEASEISEAEQSSAMGLGISFNGIQFVYRDFKYDRLPDAVAYAELDVQRMQKLFPSDPPEWMPKRIPSITDQALMNQYGIMFENLRYKYKDYRYDSLDDALGYAQKINPER